MNIIEFQNVYKQFDGITVLANVSYTFAKGSVTSIIGPSGSGKSTLVSKILFPAIQKKIGGYGEKVGQFTEITGNFNAIEHVEFINQNPIGRSSRSNPVTYIKAYDDIRALFASEKLSKIRNYQPKHFSFNVEGGRCEVCKGEGEVTIEMQFMADVHLECDVCNGKRFKKEVLEVNFEGDITTAKDFVIEVSDPIVLEGFANTDVFSFETIFVVKRLLFIASTSFRTLKSSSLSITFVLSCILLLLICLPLLHPLSLRVAHLRFFILLLDGFSSMWSIICLLSGFSKNAIATNL